MDSIFKIEHFADFQTALQEMIKNLYTGKWTCQSVNIELAKEAKDEMKQIISDHSFENDKIVQSLQSRGWEQERVKYFHSMLEDRKSEIIYDAYILMNSEHGETVKDFNWVLKLVLGTSELKSLSYPILQLVLSTTNSACEHKQLSYEVHKETLSKFITDLEVKLAS